MAGVSANHSQFLHVDFVAYNLNEVMSYIISCL